jgi:hypothetical protein
MKYKIKVLAVLVLSVCIGGSVFAQSSNIDILRQGLLGAGTGAIASSVSGGKSDAIWIGALAGAGVNIIGGSLLDVLTGDSDQKTTVRSTPVRTQPRYYKPSKKQYPQTVRKWYYEDVAAPVNSGVSQDYLDGYKQGYQEGYLLGYKEAIKDMGESR